MADNIDFAEMSDTDRAIYNINQKIKALTRTREALEDQLSNPNVDAAYILSAIEEIKNQIYVLEKRRSAIRFGSVSFTPPTPEEVKEIKDALEGLGKLISSSAAVSDVMSAAIEIANTYKATNEGNVT